MIKLQITIDQAFLIQYGKRNLRASLRSAGVEIRNVAARSVRQSVGAGKFWGGPRSPNRSSAPGAVPVRQTGQLDSAMRVFLAPAAKGDAVNILDTKAHAKFLETGRFGIAGITPQTSPKEVRRRMRRGQVSISEPRPFLSRALAGRAPSIARRIEDAVKLDIKFVRLP